MGNQASSQDKKEEDILENSNRDGVGRIGERENGRKLEQIYTIDTYSNFKGIRTDTGTDHQVTNIDKSTSNDTTSVLTTNEKNEMEGKVMTMFEWQEGGSMIYVSGNFSNWTQWFVMTKNPITGYFELGLELPKGVHQFKFIVDGKWICSKHHPTCKDEKGNVNNILDTTNITKVKKEPVKNSSTPVEELQKNLIEKYTEYFPSKTEMNLDAPHIPHHYYYKYNIDCNTLQDFIGDNEFINRNRQSDFNANNSFKSISISPHVNL